MNIFENMTKALNKPFKQFGFDNAIVTCLNNISCPTDTSIPYLSSFMLRAPVEEADLSVNEFRQGIYQIDINYASNLGSTPIDEMGDLLNQVFKTGACFEHDDIYLQVTSFDLGQLIPNNGWATAPVSINWQTYTKRL